MDTLRRTAAPWPVGVVDLRHGAGGHDALALLAADEARLVAESVPARICVARLPGDEHVVLATTRQPVSMAELEGAVGRLLAGSPPWAIGGEAAVPPTSPIPTLPPLDLPADHPRGVLPRGRSAVVTASVALRPMLDWCATHEVALTGLLTGGLVAVLARYCGYLGGEEVVFAADLPDGAGAIRARWCGATSPVALARELSESRLDDASTPQGPVLFSYVEARPDAPAVPLPLNTEAIDRELRVTVVRSGGRLDVRLEHDTDLFTHHTARQFLARLVAAWSMLTELPLLSGFTGLTRGDSDAVRVTRQGSELCYPRRCVHELVEERAIDAPDRLAVICGQEKLTYGDLAARAASAANRIRRLGGGPDRVVGVVADRSVHSVVGLLAVLRAGAAYLPVDPCYPEERIRWQLRDSGALLLVGTHDQLTALPDVPVPVAELLDGPVEPGPAPEARPANLAYLIYTSGSTGRPKAVAVTHRGLMLSTWARSVGGEPPGMDLVTMPLSFDGSAGGLYWTLTSGGTALLPTEEEVRDPRLLAKAAESWSVTHIHSIPSHYTVLREAGVEHGLKGLRLVSVGGEPLPPRLVTQHHATHPDALLLNDYGPTEATVWATAHTCSPSDGSAATVPIGPPLPNYRASVLDGALLPVPPGVPGELYLGGDALARGYHGRPGLTAERFLPDPDGEPGTRLYRTGDRVRLRPDGELEILGRVDDQVKLRGFRIELGEIEHVLLRHPAIGEAAVVLRRDSAGPRLAAYVTVGGATGEHVADWLAGELPAHMVPDEIIVLPALPRKANGKVDTGSLRGTAEEPAVDEVARAEATVDDLTADQVDQVLRHLLARTRS